ncbi:MAG: DNA adenine methylase [Puniceicoccales bacterium]|jgi:DNA adenine methylase|nr:DNA adenine methylase [Puniceicoccales bacterium]
MDTISWWGRIGPIAFGCTDGFWMETDDIFSKNFHTGIGNCCCEQKIKSPLRYPGGKSRAVPFIVDEYLGGQKTLCSPFIGGGSIEIELARRGTTVYAYDTFEPLVFFWQELLRDPKNLAARIGPYFPLEKSKFYELQQSILEIEDKKEMAAVFFVLNRSSFSGTTLSGGMSPGHPRFTPTSIERVANFCIKNLKVERMDFRESIPLHGNDFLYCDPPYLIKQRLYGNKGDMHANFNHAALADLLKSRDRWLLSYNDSYEARKMYDGYPVVVPTWTYGMGKNKKSNEILILSRDFRDWR